MTPPAAEQPSGPTTDDVPTSRLIMKPPTSVISPDQNRVIDAIIQQPGKYIDEGALITAALGSYLARRFIRNKHREGILRDAESGEVRDPRSAQHLGIGMAAEGVAIAHRYGSFSPMATQNHYKQPDEVEALDDDPQLVPFAKL
jgi:hypothetical protein